MAELHYSTVRTQHITMSEMNGTYRAIDGKQYGQTSETSRLLYLVSAIHFQS